MDLFPHDVVEHILEKLAVKSILRFKSVSRQWKSTIESEYFQRRQLSYSEHSRDPNILLMNAGEDNNSLNIEAISTLVFKSSVSFKIPIPLEIISYVVCPTSCDGLICFYSFYNSGVVVNPTTRWHRIFPPPMHKQVILKRFSSEVNNDFTLPLLGFGKDKFNAIYKPVWLYNSLELGLEHVTTCEVFDFGTNIWKYITPSSPYRIITFYAPVYVDGSLHWFTECKETKVLSLDLYTEIFQVISEVPFAIANSEDIAMCNLDNRLCISEKKWPDQMIWLFDSTNKTWRKTYSIDLNMIYSWKHFLAVLPLAVLEKKNNKNKLLFSSNRLYKQRFVVHDPPTKSYDLVLTAKSIGDHVCYLESLVSIL